MATTIQISGKLVEVLRNRKMYDNESYESVIWDLLESAPERIRIRLYPHVKKLVGNPYFRLRVGNYRVIFDIQENKLIIFVLEIGHRLGVTSDVIYNKQ